MLLSCPSVQSLPAKSCTWGSLSWVFLARKTLCCHQLLPWVCAVINYRQLSPSCSGPTICLFATRPCQPYGWSFTCPNSSAFALSQRQSAAPDLAKFHSPAICLIICCEQEREAWRRNEASRSQSVPVGRRGSALSHDFLQLASLLEQTLSESPPLLQQLRFPRLKIVQNFPFARPFHFFHRTPFCFQHLLRPRLGLPFSEPLSQLSWSGQPRRL